MFGERGVLRTRLCSENASGERRLEPLDSPIDPQMPERSVLRTRICAFLCSPSVFRERGTENAGERGLLTFRQNAVFFNS